ncbi:MAG: GNAT family N-acetyltransferase [Betaproteobacteria bacterium]
MSADFRVPALATARLVLEPLDPGHAVEAFAPFADPALYRYMVGAPPVDVDALRAHFARLQRGSGRANEIWANWLARRRDDSALAGWHQATLTPPTASIAWVTFAPFRAQGYAREGAQAVLGWLARAKAREIVAQSDERNVASGRTAVSLGFVANPEPIAETLHGEATVDRIWRLHV